MKSQLARDIITIFSIKYAILPLKVTAINVILRNFGKYLLFFFFLQISVCVYTAQFSIIFGKGQIILFAPIYVLRRKSLFSIRKIVSIRADSINKRI